MKILLAGDASNCHRSLASGLRRLGYEVTVASDGTKWMNTERDINLLRRGEGKIWGAELWLRYLMLEPRRLRGFDIVAISNPVFLSLRPQRVEKAFNLLKRHNGNIFLTALASDTPYVEMCLDPNGPLAYNEFRVNGKRSPFALLNPEIEKEWTEGPVADLCNHVYENIDGAVSVLYEYDLALSRRLPAEKHAYGGIPIDLRGIKPVSQQSGIDKVRLFLGRHADRMPQKGTDLFERAASTAIERHPGKGELIIVENRPYSEYLELMKQAHVVIDQAYSYSPATNAMLAMAYGIPAISGAEPSFLKFIGEEKLIASPDSPIINSPVDLDGMTAMFEDILLHPEQLRARGQNAREFVERNNDSELVARRFLNFWQSRMK